MRAARNLDIVRRGSNTLLHCLWLVAMASGCVKHSAYAGYDLRQFNSSPVTTAMNGGRAGWLGVPLNPAMSGFVELGYWRALSEQFGLFAADFGGRYAAFTRGPFEVGGLGSLGLEFANLETLSNSNQLISFTVGAYVEYQIAPQVSIATNLSAHAFLDATSPTTCNDGSTSESTGSGTCSHHGGIAQYNDHLGNGTGLDAIVLVRFWFDMPQ